MVELTEEKLKLLKQSIPKKVGAKIRFFRNQKGLTQTQLAQSVGKDRQYLYKIEKGLVTPNIYTITVLAATMNIKLADLFDFEI